METPSLLLDPAEGLHEECGVFGIVKAPSNLVGTARDSREPVYDTYNALYTLQHRGQDSCGIAACINGSIRLHKDQGLVPEVFSRKETDRLLGATAAIGHVRHANNTADVNPLNAQPIVVHRTSGSLALCYNGKLVNNMQLKIEMENRGAIFQTTNDAEIITYLIVREHLRTNTLED
ncbi:MAG: amidophosphoribosyltransferase, partial [Clostridiales bacterium]|nr:amidophosphoribosyltransferase [Clostridiales bacterium]